MWAIITEEDLVEMEWVTEMETMTFMLRGTMELMWAITTREVGPISYIYINNSNSNNNYLSTNALDHPDERAS